MSRVGKRILIIPDGATAEVTGSKIKITGKLGTLERQFSPLIAINVNGNEISTTRANEEKHTKQLHGTTNSLIAGMITGVTNGFQKEIAIKGVGYRAAVKEQTIEINAGYSHPVVLPIIAGVKITTPKPIEVVVSGIDKQLVGQMAALIRNVRRPSPYSGKGIMYKGEQIRRKEGKAAAK